MKNSLFILIFITTIQKGHSQTPFYFDPRCTDYLINFCRGLLTNSTDCRQWTGTCDLTTNIQRNGGVMIGANNLLDSKLAVSGGIISTSLRVLNNLPWPDYVFDKSYELMPLKDVKTFIDKNGHLPKTPSAAEIEKEGSFEIGSVFINHQEKIEEIFLHLIDLKKSADALQKENETLDSEYVSLTMQLIDKMPTKQMRFK
jgi:hypothetical protein